MAMCPETSISEIVRHSVIMTSFVFGMMTLVDYINVVTGGRLGAVLGRGPALSRSSTSRCGPGISAVGVI